MRSKDFEGAHLALARLAKVGPARSARIPDVEPEVDALAAEIDAVAKAAATPVSRKPELWSGVLARLIRKDRFAILPDGLKKRRRAT